jgi:hypothetical protein
MNRSVDLDEILYGSDGIEYYLGYIMFNSVTIPKWQTFKLLRCLLLLNRLVDLNYILYEVDGIEDDIVSILINPASSTIPK